MFVPLRVHSVYSRGEGSLTLEELVQFAEKNRLPAMALTDIAAFYGWGKWKALTEGRGFKPVFGCELELDFPVKGSRYVFLVKEKKGYCRLLEFFNRKQFLEPEGLVTIFILPEKLPAAEVELEEWVRTMRKVQENVAEDFYLGCGLENFEAAEWLSARSGQLLLWMQPLKYLRSSQRLVLLRAIEQKIPYPPEFKKLAPFLPGFGLEQEKIVLKKYGERVKPVFKRNLEVAEKINFSFEAVVPPLPSDLFPVTLRQVINRKLSRLRNLSWREREQAVRELQVVEESGFAPYFLVVHDVVEFACGRGIYHNLRGSGASSYLAYLLGISRLNPVKYDLYFERFLNRGRPDPPDFDLDFESARRDEVLEYVLRRYGSGKTGAAYVCSLKNYRARSALYETARAFGVSPEEARAMSKKVPMFAEPDYLRQMPPQAGYLEIWKLASELSGVFAEISLHVGGVILTPAPVERFLPLAESAKGLLMCHYDRDTVEELQLIKLDLLSTRGLTAISETRKALRLEHIPPDDRQTYALLQQARTIGCFQVESPAMMNLLRRMKPENLSDLIHALALIRPGPTESGMKEAFLRRREGKAVAEDPLLAKVLPETGGLMFYEEQVMQVAERVAGFPPEEGELLRRQLKKRRVEEKLRQKFFQQALSRGYSASEIEALWQKMEKFSSYSFNRAHSASYALMAYEAVYLKAHHPLTYMTAMLNAGGGYYQLPEYVEEAKRLGIAILGPDVNRSGYRFQVEGKAIRVGLGSIKSLTLKTVEKIISEREKDGPYLSVEDFLSRIKPGQSDLLCLIQAGALDSLEPNRSHQVLWYFQGVSELKVADLNEEEKKKLQLELLGFLPAGDPLDFLDGRRPPLRVAQLKELSGQMVELAVRVVDAREIRTAKGLTYFYLFEDETGLVEGVGQRKALAFGSPPVCFLRAEVRLQDSSHPRLVNCTFLKTF
ncbi:MAG: DNA polymerase III subunit alpha [Candidatus Saccharicenans sp.]|uniref:DNA polymerase III subunit alpha n=1 Tax=Candidatus Saccharicenans sp. TaxID=2819258 RepID=UPI00404A2346